MQLAVFKKQSGLWKFAFSEAHKFSHKKLICSFAYVSKLEFWTLRNSCHELFHVYSNKLMTPQFDEKKLRQVLTYRFLRAICKTARSSVKLIVSPANMESRPASTFRDLARSIRRSKTSWSIRFFEKSTRMSPSSGVLITRL